MVIVPHSTTKDYNLKFIGKVQHYFLFCVNVGIRQKCLLISFYGVREEGRDTGEIHKKYLLKQKTCDDIDTYSICSHFLQSLSQLVDSTTHGMFDDLQRRVVQFLNQT